MKRAVQLLTLVCAILIGTAGASEHRRTPFVVLISIDGLKPEAVIDAASHGLKIPNLRAFIAEGRIEAPAWAATVGNEERDEDEDEHGDDDGDDENAAPG